MRTTTAAPAAFTSPLIEALKQACQVASDERRNTIDAFERYMSDAIRKGRDIARIEVRMNALREHIFGISPEPEGTDTLGNRWAPPEDYSNHGNTFTPCPGPVQYPMPDYMTPAGIARSVRFVGDGADPETVALLADALDKALIDIGGDPISEPHESALTVGDALDALKLALRNDDDFAWGWHSNIAMSLMDSSSLGHRLANVSAAHLMLALFDVDTAQSPNYAALMRNQDRADAAVGPITIGIDLGAEAMAELSPGPIVAKPCEHRLFTERASELRSLLSSIYDRVVKKRSGTLVPISFGTLCEVMNLLEPVRSPEYPPPAAPPAPTASVIVGRDAKLGETVLVNLTETLAVNTTVVGGDLKAGQSARADFVTGTIWPGNSEQAPEATFFEVIHPSQYETLQAELAAEGEAQMRKVADEVKDMAGFPSTADAAVAAVDGIFNAVESTLTTGDRMIDTVMAGQGRADPVLKIDMSAVAAKALEGMDPAAHAPDADFIDIAGTAKPDAQTQGANPVNRRVFNKGDIVRVKQGEHRFAVGVYVAEREGTRDYATVEYPPGSKREYIIHLDDLEPASAAEAAKAVGLMNAVAPEKEEASKEVNQQETIQPGHIVRLRSGGPLMAAGLMNGKGLRACAWWRDGLSFGAEFHDAMLEKASMPEAPPKEDPPQVPTMVKPTIGRRVWFFTDPRYGQSGLQVLDHEKPLDAGIVFVTNDRQVNLDVTDHMGNHHPFYNVTLVHPGDEKPTTGYWCEWMPFQLKQAAK